MNTSSKQVVLSVRNNDHCKRLTDPVNASVFHMETLLPFSEVVKTRQRKCKCSTTNRTKAFPITCSILSSILPIHFT